METEYRGFEVRLEAEAAAPGVLTGVLMAYGVRASDRPELFEPGALHWDQGGVVLREQHNRQAPICRFVPTVEDKEVRVRIELPDTSRGRDAAVGVKSGLYRGLSVEFRATDELQQGGVRRIKKAQLLGAGLVDDPSYKQCSVSVRNRVDAPPEIDTLWL